MIISHVSVLNRENKDFAWEKKVNSPGENLREKKAAISLFMGANLASVVS